MKKTFVALAMIGTMAFSLTAYGGEPETVDSAELKEEATMAVTDVENMEDVGEAPDYSKTECWYKIPEITKDVDTFYIRQAGMAFVLRKMAENGSIDSAMSGTPYDDVTAALDYYFENYNEGRPFVIAGHSQGAAILRLVLQGYFKEHPEYYERMVAAYAIGFSVTKDYLESNPHLKFASGESDTGVIISWNTEGPKNVEENAVNALVLPNAISINPLNWKLDETYAPASENLGSIVLDEKTGTTEIRDINGDAQVNLARGTVITNADAVPNDMSDYTGPQSYHQDDYSIFYNNIKDNVAKRIAAYQANQ